MSISQDRKTVRQNGAYTTDLKHEVNLKRNPTLHFQIGLILALLVSIIFIELKLPEKKIATRTLAIEDDPIEYIGDVQVERIKAPKINKPKVTVAKPVIHLEGPEIVKDEVKLKETIFDDTEHDSKDRIVDVKDVEVVEVVESIESVPFIVVEEVPLFPGCENEKDNKAKRACMSSKINKLVRKKFNTNKAVGLGLPGVNRIHSFFTIDQDGKIIDVLVKAAHPELEKEARRVIGLLPDMTPGKQRGKPVKVQFSLPILFQVED